MWWIGGGGNRSVCFCDLRFFFGFFGEACSRERVGETGMVELVGLVEVVVFWGCCC